MSGGEGDNGGDDVDGMVVVTCGCCCFAYYIRLILCPWGWMPNRWILTGVKYREISYTLSCNLDVMGIEM